MRRRRFLVLVAATVAAPLAAEAQQAGTVRRIGYLSSGSATSIPRNVEEFRQGLRELGLVEGQDIVIDYRFAEGRFDRLPDLAAELVRLKVDVIVAVPTPPAVAAKNATRTIPIVIISAGDPVGLGLRREPRAPGWERHRVVLQRRRRHFRPRRLRRVVREARPFGRERAQRRRRLAVVPVDAEN